MTDKEGQASIPEDVKAQFDEIVGKATTGGGLSLARIFDPYVPLRKYIEKHPELIEDGFGVLAGSYDKKHLNFIRQVMEGNPDSVEAGLQALAENNSENAFAVFRSFLEDNSQYAREALRVLSEYMSTYVLKIEGEKTSEIKGEKGFNTLQIRGLAETVLSRPDIYGFHPVEMLEFIAEYAAVRDEESIRGSHHVFVEKILRSAEDDPAFFKELSSQQKRDSVQSSLLRLWELESVDSKDLGNFDKAVEKKTGTGLGFVLQWKAEPTGTTLQRDLTDQPAPRNLH